MAVDPALPRWANYFRPCGPPAIVPSSPGVTIYSISAEQTAAGVIPSRPGRPAVVES